MPYLASHWSRLDISEWSTFRANRSTLDRGRSNEAADEGHSSVANGSDWKSSSAKLCRTFSAGSCCCCVRLVDALAYWDEEDVGSVVNWQREWPANNNKNNRIDIIISCAAAAAARFNWCNTITTPICSDFSAMAIVRACCLHRCDAFTVAPTIVLTCAILWPLSAWSNVFSYAV